MNDWDPMKEDFFDLRSSIVSNDGPLKNLSRQVNLNDDRNGNFKECECLYIKNIPMNMSMDNLFDCLSNHGNVLSVRFPRHTDLTMKIRKKVAFANVLSFQDGLNIITALNGKDPLKLNIQKALTQDEKNKRKNISSNFQSEMNTDLNATHEGAEIDEKKPLVNHAEPIMSLKNTFVNCMKKIENFANNITAKEDSAISCKMEIPEIMKSVIHISRGNGKRFKNPFPCVRCNIIGTKRCSVCKAYYCSKECQEDDWFNHMKICAPPPILLDNNCGTAVEINEEMNAVASTNQPFENGADEVDHFIKLNRNSLRLYSNNKTSSGKPVRRPLGYSQENVDIIIESGNCTENVSKKVTVWKDNTNEIKASNNVLQSQSVLSTEPRSEFVASLNVNSACDSYMSDNIVNGIDLESNAITNDEANTLETSKNKIKKLMERVEYIHSIDSMNKNKYISVDLSTNDKEIASNGILSTLKDVTNTNVKVIENVTSKYECGEIYEVYVVTKESVEDFNVIAQLEYTDIILSAEQSRVSAGKSLTSAELSCNDIIVGKSIADNDWYRARVCSLEPNSFVKVCYIDYGNVEIIKDIKSLPIEFNCSAYPGLAMNITLYKNIPSEQLVKFDNLVRIEENVKFKVIAKKSSSLKVVFLDNCDQELAVCIIKPLQLWKITQIYEQEPIVEGHSKDNIRALSMNLSSRNFFKDQLKSLTIMNGQEYNVILTYVMEDLCICLQLTFEENLKLLADVIETTMFHCDTASKPSVDSLAERNLVCALFDNIWYRGEIINISDDRISVHFFDFGNTDFVSLDNLRAFDSALLEFPILCLQVKPVISQQQRQKAKEIFNRLLEKEEKFVMRVVSLNPIEAIMRDSVGKDLFPDVSLPTITEEPHTEQVTHLVQAEKIADSEISSTSKPLRKYYNRELTPLTLAIGEEYTVILTWILEDFHTCLQIVSAKNTNALVEIMEMCTVHCEKASKLSIGTLTENELVCAYYEDLWYRGEIVSISDNKICVHFFDFGNTDFVPLDNLRAFDSSFLEYPILCHQVKPRISQQQRKKVKEIFNSLLEKEEKFVMKVVSLDPLEAIMKDCMGKDLFPVESQTISTLPSAPSSTVPKNSKAITDKKVMQLLEEGTYKPIFKKWDECKSVSLLIQNDVYVIIMKASDPMNIFVVPEKDSKLFNELEELNIKINEYCRTFKSPYYHPRIGEVVLAKCSEDGNWYRAAVIEVEDNNVVVFFVDFGNAERVMFKSLCQIIDVFLDVPLFVLHCILGDATVKRLADQQEDYLSSFESILSTPSINIVDVLSHSDEDGTYVIEIPSLCSSP